MNATRPGRPASRLCGAADLIHLERAQHRIDGEVGHADPIRVEERARAQEVHQIGQSVVEPAQQLRRLRCGAPAPAEPAAEPATGRGRGRIGSGRRPRGAARRANPFLVVPEEGFVGPVLEVPLLRGDDRIGGEQRRLGPELVEAEQDVGRVRDQLVVDRQHRQESRLRAPAREVLGALRLAQLEGEALQHQRAPALLGEGHPGVPVERDLRLHLTPPSGSASFAIAAPSCQGLLPARRQGRHA